MGLIIAGWAGVGKTKLAEKYPSQVIDLESSAFKWLEGGSEAHKGLPGRTLNPAYPENYLAAIAEAHTKYQVVCVALHQDIQELMAARNLLYLYVFPHSEDMEVYRNRYVARGNNPSFYAQLDSLWLLIDKLKSNTHNAYVVLKPDSTLEDFLLEATTLLDTQARSRGPLLLSGIAGVGKTTLALKYPDRVRDFESTCWKWVGGGEEETKGVLGLEPNLSYPDNMFSEVVYSLSTYEILCLSYHKEINQALRKRNLTCTYVFPCYQDKEVYAQRYRVRGNTDYFVDRVTGNWDIILTLQSSLEFHLLVLGKDSTLEDHLKMFGHFKSSVQGNH